MYSEIKSYEFYKTPYVRLSPEKTKELFQRSKSGDLKARETLILNNLKLAMKFAGISAGRNMEYDDACQEAMIPLMNAVEKFDSSRGSFSSYAVPAIIRHLSGKSPCHHSAMPISAKELMNYSANVSRLNTNKKIASKHPSWEQLEKQNSKLETTIADFEKTIPQITSLDAFEELNISQLGVDQDFKDADFSDHVKDLLFSTLNSRDALIVLNYFGIDNQGSLNYAEIGRKYNLTRERVRQIVSKSIYKLRKSPDAKKLYQSLVN